MGFCKLEVTDSTGYVGGVYYDNGFKQAIFLRIEENFLGIEYEEDGETDVYDYYRPYHQSLKYRYSFTTYCHQFTAEALAMLKLHDSIQITLANGTWGTMKDIDVSIAPMEIGCLAAVTVTYSISANDIIKTGGCTAEES